MTSSILAIRALVASLFCQMALFCPTVFAAEPRSGVEAAPPVDNGTLSGTIHDAADGVTPVYPVSIVLLDPVTGAIVPNLNVSNDVDGTYSLTEIPAGDYKVFFNAFGAANHYGDELYDGLPCDAGSCDTAGSGNVFTVFGTENILNVDLTRNLSLSGRVTGDSNEPLPGVSVLVFDEAGSPVSSAAVTNTSGEWVKGVPGPGTYYVRTVGNSAPGYQPEVWENVPCAECDVVAIGTPVVVSASDIEGIDFELDSLFDDNPFNGMSATDIKLAAVEALGSPPVPAGHCNDGLDELTGVNLMNFNFTKTTGRPGHEGLVPNDQQPEPGERQAIAELWGPWSNAQFRLVDESGTDIQTISMASSGIEFAEMFWAGPVDVPNQSFRAAVSGMDNEGQAFDITCSHLFNPQTVSVAFDQSLHKTGPGPYALSATVTNNGPSETFDLAFSNDLGLPIDGSPSQLYVASGETAQALVNVSMPAFTSGTLDVTVKVEAKGVGNPARLNHGTTLVRAERFILIFNDSFGADAVEETP